MKNKLLISFIISMTILITSPLAMAIEAPKTQMMITEDITRQQMEAQISFFNGALNEFGAVSPDQAVELWVKGDKTRNGVYKYSVSSDSMKEMLIKRWGKPEKRFWIIGGSSPWLASFQVLSKGDISPIEKVYVVRYNWDTSAGPEAPSVEKLVVQKIKDKWCISNVIQVSGHQYY